jgi:Protein of unknown function (DUF1566)
MWVRRKPKPKPHGVDHPPSWCCGVKPYRPRRGSSCWRTSTAKRCWIRTPASVRADWRGARSSCLNKAIGGQRGWGLPSIVELISLLDPSIQDADFMLPVGHPFLNNPSGFYWSASADGESSKAWHLHLSNGHVHMTSKASAFKAWCVRGGSPADQ